MLLDRITRLLQYTSYIGVWISLDFGVFVRSVLSSNSSWIVTAAVVCECSVVAVVALAMSSSSGCIKKVRTAVLSFCPSLVLGVVAFNQDAKSKEHKFEYVMELVLVGATGLHIIWIFVRKSFQTRVDSCLIKSTDVYSIFGLVISIMTSKDHHRLGFILSVLYIGILILAFHRKSILPALTLPMYVLLNHRVILDNADHINVMILCIYMVQLVSEPIVNVFINTTTTLDCWKPVFDVPRCILRLSWLVIVCVEICLLVLTALSLQQHKEWWVILPIYFIMAILIWTPLHIAYAIIVWKLCNRVKKCVDIYQTDKSRSLQHIMASRGLRHFALITYPLMWFNLLMTSVQFIWSWTTMTPVTCGLILLCLSIQLILISLLRELSISLGGTCCGYALVTPAVLKRADEGNLNEVHTSSSYATRTIRLITDFFNHHLIQDGGCEYLSDRMTENKLQEKLMEFFSMKTSEDNSFDTYLLYYSGPVNADGDWLLKENGVFTYQKLMTFWLNHDVSKTSRLILVLDTAKSNYWVPLVRRTTAAFVGIQTLFVRKEAEVYHEFNIGDFTMNWIEFNCNPHSDIYGSNYESPIIVTYGISPYWTNFRFQQPSHNDVAKYWQENFSFNLRVFVYLADLFTGNRLCCMCRGLSSCLVLARIWMWSPDQLDVGHGFKFVRFFKLPGDRILV